MINPLLIGHIVSLLLGGSIYILFRDTSIIFFGWLNKLGLTSTIQLMQDKTSSMRFYLPNWGIYSLPDGLWLFSFVCLMLYIWRRSLNRTALIWVFSLPLVVLIFEILQLIKPSLGTFDLIDILFYLIATLLPFVLFGKRINFIPNSMISHEK